MSNSDVPPENGAEENEVESPVDGPTPDWMKMATSASSGPTLSEENTPDWLKDIKAGKGTGPLKEKSSAEEEDSNAGMSDLERLLAEEGIDLETVAEERPEGAEGMSARDFMISTSDDELIRSQVGAEPMTEQTAAPPTQEIAESLPVSAPAPSAEEEDSNAGMSDLERLLAEEGIDLGTVAEERPEGSEGMSARDYMISTSDDELIRSQVGAEPITEESPAPPSQQGQERPPTPSPAPEPIPAVTKPEDDKMIADDELPDWLREVDEEEPAPTLEPWATASEYGDDKMVVEDDLPDWLQDAGDEAPPAPAPIPAATGQEDDKMGADDDLPDWLREVDEEEPAPVTEPQAAASEPVMTMAASDIDDDKMVVEDDLPDWLQDTGDEAPPAPEPIPTIAEQEDDKMLVNDDLPDWLSAADDESFEEEESDEDLPAWLSDIEEDMEEPAPQPGTAPTPAAPIADEGDIDIEDDELPDWLKEAQEDESVSERISSPIIDRVVATLDTDDSAISDEDLPDWLQDAQDDDVSQSLLDADTLSTDDMVADEDLPDWLSDVQADESDEPFEPSEPTPSELEETVDEDLPDWLQEVKDEVSIPTSEPVGAISLEDDGLGEDKELPDWLQDMEDSSEFLGETEVVPIPEAPRPQPAPISADRGEAEGGAESVAEEEIEEPATTTRAAPPPVSPAPSSGDMPDWLKKLRAGEDEKTEVAPRPEAPAPTPSPAPPQPVAKAVAVPAPSPTVPEIEEDKLPADADERLKLAQTAREKGDMEEAVRYYDSLVSSGVYLDTIIEDMQQAIKAYPSNYMLFQVMGDAMMRDGRLQSALNAYRQALEKLPR